MLNMQGRTTSFRPAIGPAGELATPPSNTSGEWLLSEGLPLDRGARDFWDARWGFKESTGPVIIICTVAVSRFLPLAVRKLLLLAACRKKPKLISLTAYRPYRLESTALYLTALL